MVSLLSLFTSKKRPKHSDPPSPTAATDPSSPGPKGVSAPSPTISQSRRPNRFLSIRSRLRSTTKKPYDLPTAKRRPSADVQRKRSSRQRATSLELPKLDLGWEAQAGIDGPLGLSDLGAIPMLSRTEREGLEAQRFSPEQVKEGWKMFGEGLKQAGGLELPGVLLPTRGDPDRQDQLYLLALFALTTDPSLLGSFPCLTGRFPPSDRAEDTQADIWRVRLLSMLKESSAADIAECLKWIIRRLKPSLNTPSRGILDSASYTRFVRAEHASSYPQDAYSSMLRPGLSSGAAAMLDEVFDVWAMIATHGETNGMPAGRICLFLGWSLWGQGVAEAKDGESWRSMYEGWQEAGRRTEHLFYAWIRDQSIRQQLPARLLHLVDQYPFGESSASSEHLPLPPTSTFTRKALVVEVMFDQPLRSAINPEEILKIALERQLGDDSTCSKWAALRAKAPIGSTSDAKAEIIAEASRTFLSDAATGRRKDGNPIVNDTSHGHGSALRTIHADRVTPHRTHSRKRSQSCGDAPAMSNGSSTHSTPLNKPRADSYGRQANRQHGANGGVVIRQASASMLRSPSDTSNWDDFTKAGFLDSPEEREVKLALTPSRTMQSIASTSLLTPTTEAGSASKRLESPKNRAAKLHAEAAAATYLLKEEKVVDLDDTFMAFVEDGQLDPSVFSDWPPLCLVRLAQPIALNQPESTPIEWLLIALTYQAPLAASPLVHEFARIRSKSPGTASTASRLSPGLAFRDFASSFRRSSSSKSNTVTRRSLFGGNSRTFSMGAAGGEGSSTLAESGTVDVRETILSKPVSTAAPAGHAVGEMGEMKTTQHIAQTMAVGLKAARAGEGGPGSPIAPVRRMEEATKGHADPWTETAFQDWAYVAEGGAHVVFAYRGLSSTHFNRVLRVRKGSPMTSGLQDERQTVWRDELLPQLVPPELLSSVSEVILRKAWVKNLLEHVSAERPEFRKGEADPGVTGQCFLMENLSMTTGLSAGTKAMAVEIKPKWGFMPFPDFIQPPEAIPIKTQNCRYCMLVHLRHPDGDVQRQWCPLDLYSGDANRMSRALKELWEGWRASEGKWNSLRVLVDGKTVLPEAADVVPGAMDGTMAEMTEPFIRPLLEHSHVLQTLKKLQSTLDPTDISDLVARLRRARPPGSDVDFASVAEPTAQELRDFIHLYISSPAAGTQDDGSWTLCDRLIAYSLSAIFKDCSIIVKAVLRPTKDGHYELVESESSVKLIDLDLKPLGNLRKWAELDENVWRFWAETKGSGDSGALRGTATSRKNDLPTRSSPAVGGEVAIAPAAVIATGTPSEQLAEASPHAGRLIISSTPSADEPPEMVMSSRQPSAPATPEEERNSLSLDDALALASAGSGGKKPVLETLGQDAELSSVQRAGSTGVVTSDDITAAPSRKEELLTGVNAARRGAAGEVDDNSAMRSILLGAGDDVSPAIESHGVVAVKDYPNRALEEGNFAETAEGTLPSEDIAATGEIPSPRAERSAAPSPSPNLLPMVQPPLIQLDELATKSGGGDASTTTKNPTARARQHTGESPADTFLPRHEEQQADRVHLSHEDRGESEATGHVSDPTNVHRQPAEASHVHAADEPEPDTDAAQRSASAVAEEPIHIHQPVPIHSDFSHLLASEPSRLPALEPTPDLVSDHSSSPVSILPPVSVSPHVPIKPALRAVQHGSDLSERLWSPPAGRRPGEGQLSPQRDRVIFQRHSLSPNAPDPPERRPSSQRSSREEIAVRLMELNRQTSGTDRGDSENRSGGSQSSSSRAESADLTARVREGSNWGVATPAGINAIWLGEPVGSEHARPEERIYSAVLADMRRSTYDLLPSSPTRLASRGVRGGRDGEAEDVAHAVDEPVERGCSAGVGAPAVEREDLGSAGGVEQPAALVGEAREV